MSARITGIVVVLLAVTLVAGCATPPGVVSRKLPAELVEVMVVRVEIDPEAEAQKVILQEKGGMRSLPIFIDLPEARAIQRTLDGRSFTRPMTHDLAANLVGALGGTLERVVIELQDKVFIATLVIKKGLGTTQVDARASDALALALRTNASIFVSNALLARISVELAPGPGAP